jgi:DNA mismatch endonuclease, patch repair protein
MADVLTPEQRRHNMQRVQGRDTKPEMLVRRNLHSRGFRYRLHRSDLPGRPDLVFPKYHAVIFIHGCFWHGHDCPLFQWPATRKGFWREKIERTRTRDRQAIKELKEAGWRILVVWECALRGPERPPLDEAVEVAATFLMDSPDAFHELCCQPAALAKEKQSVTRRSGDKHGDGS